MVQTIGQGVLNPGLKSKLILTSRGERRRRRKAWGQENEFLSGEIISPLL